MLPGRPSETAAFHKGLRRQEFLRETLDSEAFPRGLRVLDLLPEGPSDPLSLKETLDSAVFHLGLKLLLPLRDSKAEHLRSVVKPGEDLPFIRDPLTESANTVAPGEKAASSQNERST